jgi:divalent metal cation (Fe/Co/Zn/Cd) transporter
VQVSRELPIVLGTARSRAGTVARALRLEYLTVGWNVVEGVVAIAAALAAGSVALLAFGIDSFVECASGLILIWRLRAERTARDRAAIERLDRRAHQLVGWSLFVLAAWVGHALWTAERPAPSAVGIGLLLVSIAAMGWLARAKRRAAAALGSRALAADSFQTSACFWLSVIGLAGITANAALGWWWADPVAALGIAALLVREGREGLRGVWVILGAWLARCSRSSCSLPAAAIRLPTRSRSPPAPTSRPGRSRT